jgi:hypothetical protein
MSELKAIHFMTHFNGDYEAFYPKDEADKVIAHHKYKRCLAMAEQCRESLRLMRTYEVTDDYWNLELDHDAEYFCKKGDFYSKWRKRWLELAEKFKEEN